ncbi:hypothetical protein [Sulfurimonas marina]|uniref:Uncharacterized protein n=1 Tax=Sulfurimonas marina TaxID=2590551 RepID=A0A7M3V8Y1_9BACT|nr:hypothetical protein [Sulfurimonas marina]QOP40214.1 hypothetical protein FJR03_00040 [Sulfurimonas marina]
MFGKILGNKSNDIEEGTEIDPNIVERVSKMNLSDMRLYVNNKITGFEISVEGLHEVLKRLINPINDKGEYYLKKDDMDSKKKKAFELILLISKSKKISLGSIELIDKFLEVYKEIIDDYDDRYKEIYHSRFRKAVETAIINMQTISQVNKKLDVLK